MFDATRAPPRTPTCSYDDDILCEPEILLRLTAFASVHHPTIVGGQMLNLLHPAHLHISAEDAELSRLRAGRCAQAYLLGHDERTC